MANPNEEHIEILNKAFREGADVWNQWREDNPDITPSLNEAELQGVPLNGFNLSKSSMIEVDLRAADLKGASLVEADIHESNLDGADLSGADLSNADLERIAATGANFSGANLTGASIKDWNINSKTNLNGVICDYVYLERNQQERRPHSRNFQPGEFAKLFKKALETVDIVFLDGIDWKAFLLSFVELKAETGSDEISIQSFENRNGAFIVRINVPPDTDKAEIERFIEEKYQMAIEAQDKHIASLEEQISIRCHENTELRSELLNLAKKALEMSEKPNIENNFYSYNRELQKEDYQYVIGQDWKRFTVLKAIYRDSGGKSSLATSATFICETTGISGEECVYILEYLEREELIKAIGSLYGHISIIAAQITHKGIREVEAAIKKPNESTEHFPYQIFQTTFNAPVAGFQQGGKENSSTIQQNIRSNMPFPNNQTS